MPEGPTQGWTFKYCGGNAKFFKCAYNYAFLPRSVSYRAICLNCPGGEIGRRRGLKIPRREACRFDSGPGHHHRIKALPH